MSSIFTYFAILYGLQSEIFSNIGVRKKIANESER